MNTNVDLTTPEAIHHQFQYAINAGNLDFILNLYENQASLVLSDGRILSGLEAIRDHFVNLIKMRPTMQILQPTVIFCEGLAVLIANWQLVGTLANGENFNEVGRTYDVLRKQVDGTWRIVFDSPWGARWQ